MEFIKPDVNVDFIGRRRTAFIVSGVLILISLLSLVIKGGPNYGIDFAGGTLVQIKFSDQMGIGDVRDAVKDVDIEGGSSVQTFGAQGNNEFLIRVERTDQDLQEVTRSIETGLKERFGEGAFEIRRTEIVGPKVGKELQRKGFLSIIYALTGILLYITWRFEFRFALGAILALVHDVIITIGAFSITGKEFNLPIIAALLTIIGYSLNDTIIVYDRIRENMRKLRKVPFNEMINRSINATLSRTILTSITTMLVVLSLFLLGGGEIHDFAFTLIIGILIGTYSSIFVASPALVLWESIMAKRSRKK